MQSAVFLACLQLLVVTIRLLIDLDKEGSGVSVGWVLERYPNLLVVMPTVTMIHIVILQLAWAWSKKKELIAWSSMAIVFMVGFVPFGVAPMAVFGVTWVPFQIILGLVWAGRAIALILVIPTLLAFFL